MERTYDQIVTQLEANLPLFAALGDKNRLKIILLMACEQTPLSVGELARRTVLSRPAVSHHIRILKDAGLLLERREGVRRYYTPTFRRGVESLTALVENIATVQSLMK